MRKMGCIGCSVNGSPKGCKNNGGCSTGGCNRLNTYDWLSQMDFNDTDVYNLVEVSFKNGARKNFYINQGHTQAITGDMVVVESGNGFDIGRVSLSGELVRLQMKKKRISEDSILFKVIRRANERDLEKLHEARKQEKPTMVRSRVIARTLGLEMKIGDVEYQGDKRKATFYYTADGRVDFRELIRHYAKEFRVKIEMRQIGARQESARIGGLGSCGRELCCSTWLTDFKSVSTSAARYQNLAINQSKLSGQCGRLKCCLNYELDTYLDALEDFPVEAENLETVAGKAVLIKTDIFKGIMYYAYTHEGGRGTIYPIPIARVKVIRALNIKGEKPDELIEKNTYLPEEIVIDFENVNEVLELPPEEKRRRKKKKKNSRRRPPRNQESKDKKPSNNNNNNKRNNNRRPPNKKKD